MLKAIDRSPIDTLTTAEHYQYDAGGNLVQKTGRLGQISGYSHRSSD
jgi:hypothetical protein